MDLELYKVVLEQRQIKWDGRFLALAGLVAGWSKDPSLKCGAVVVRPDLSVASVGYNGFPRGMEDGPELYADRDKKLSRVVHAEMNAILAAKEPLLGYTLYVSPIASCDRCAVHVIQAGIKTVVFRGLSTSDLTAAERWRPMLENAVSYYREAGVEVRVHS